MVTCLVSRLRVSFTKAEFICQQLELFFLEQLLFNESTDATSKDWCLEDIAWLMGTGEYLGYTVSFGKENLTCFVRLEHYIKRISKLLIHYV